MIGDEAHERGIDGKARREDDELLAVSKARIQEVERLVQVGACKRRLPTDRLGSLREDALHHGQNASLGPQGGVHGPAGCRGADAVEELGLLGQNEL